MKNVVPPSHVRRASGGFAFRLRDTAEYCPGIAPILQAGSVLRKQWFTYFLHVNVTRRFLLAQNSSPGRHDGFFSP